jgi:FixJ family two-component response regulator
VIVVTELADVAAVRQAFLSGVVDFLAKPVAGEQLLQAIDRALADV